MNTLIRSFATNNRAALEIVLGDITEERVDAIVNAANSDLAHGGGVAGAIVRKGGSIIQDESWKVAPIPVGQAAITGAGNLPAKYVIHAVGPRWGEGDEDRKLASAVSSAIRLAEQKGLSSLSLPAISTGIFGFPLEKAAEISIESIAAHFHAECVSSLKTIRLCLFDRRSVEVFEQAAEQHFGDETSPGLQGRKPFGEW